LIAAGAAVTAPGVGRPAIDNFTGYGGVGDYANANGNTWSVIQSAHRVRDGVYGDAALEAAVPAGRFDLVVVGGGIAGLSPARRFRQTLGSKVRVLVLENHAMVGGEARQNEFDVSAQPVGPCSLDRASGVSLRRGRRAQSSGTRARRLRPHCHRSL